MLSEKSVTILLLAAAAAGLLTVSGYALWSAPLLEESLTASSEPASVPPLDLPVIPNAEYPLDLNAASAEELERLPGIGAVLAERIVQYRAENGAFQSAEELLEVTGIGEKLLSEIRERIMIRPVPQQPAADENARGASSQSSGQQQSP